MMTAHDPARIAAELAWLQQHPWFDEKPASIREFLGEGYLDVESKVRAGVKQVLIDIFGEEVNPNRIAKYRYGMFTGAIGIGKTTLASIVIPYMAHWILCLRDPQDYYDLMPGSRIAFMQMSTSEDQAVETVFGDIKARIEHCQWFTEKFPMDPKFTKQIRFEKDIWVLPGSSLETAFEGYNILGGILDEADSHKKTKEKDYADVGWDTIDRRVDSRFQDRGFLLTIGQMKSATGFAKAKYDELQADPEESYTVRMTIWESLGWQKFTDADGNRISFWYDRKRKEIVTKEAAELLGYPEHIMEIPKVYEKGFRNNPEKSLRDLAGIPPAAHSTFISLTYRIEEARDRWHEHYPEVGSPVDENPQRPKIHEWFKALDSIRRTCHIDIGYSGDGDAAGFAMGHVSSIVDIDGEEKPYITIDCIMRFRAAPGQEIMIGDIRQVIYELKNERGFKISSVTMDGFQSKDTEQQLRKRKIAADYLSIDKSKGPYEDLRDALYERRIEFPKYMTYLNVGDDKPIEITFKELSELEDGDKKIDHPVKGSKDVADCLAGVVATLMGDRTYRRGVRSSKNRELLSDEEFEARLKKEMEGLSDRPFTQDSASGGLGLSAPVPPSSTLLGVMSIPKGLQPPGRNHR
jgi:hypothetical protein